MTKNSKRKALLRAEAEKTGRKFTQVLAQRRTQGASSPPTASPQTQTLPPSMPPNPPNGARDIVEEAMDDICGVLMNQDDAVVSAIFGTNAVGFAHDTSEVREASFAGSRSINFAASFELAGEQLDERGRAGDRIRGTVTGTLALLEDGWQLNTWVTTGVESNAYDDIDDDYGCDPFDGTELGALRRFFAANAIGYLERAGTERGPGFTLNSILVTPTGWLRSFAFNLGRYMGFYEAGVNRSHPPGLRGLFGDVFDARPAPIDPALRRLRELLSAAGLSDAETAAVASCWSSKSITRDRAELLEPTAGEMRWHGVTPARAVELDRVVRSSPVHVQTLGDVVTARHRAQREAAARASEQVSPRMVEPQKTLESALARLQGNDVLIVDLDGSPRVITARGSSAEACAALEQLGVLEHGSPTSSAPGWSSWFITPGHFDDFAHLVRR